MKRLVETFVKYPFYANMSVVLIIAIGIVSILSMKKSFFPETNPKIINITVVYPGASPKEIEEGVTSRIEEGIRSVTGIKEIRSTSFENFSNVTIETLKNYPIDDVLMEVKNAVDGISSFPVDAERPIVQKQRPSTPAMWLSLSGDVNKLTLKKMANEIEVDFLNSGIISQVQAFGLKDVEISIEVSEENLRRYGLTFNHVLKAVATNNNDVSGGIIRSPEEEMIIRMRSRSVQADKIGNIIVASNSLGGYIRVRDIATVKKQLDETPNELWVDGKPGMSMFIQKLPEEDIEKISNYVNEYAEEFNKKYNNVKFEVSFDFTSLLQSRLDMLIENGLLGVILVVISLALFLSLRLSLWVAFGIPASFLMMFALAASYGITINMISLFGMILVIGILVDDGIVIGENIYSHFEKGKTPKRAAIDGTLEVMPAVITSVTTTIIAFSPLFFVSGHIEFLMEMAFVVVISLAFSLFEAFYILPAHLGSSHVLTRKKSDNVYQRFKTKVENGIAWLRSKYRNALEHLIVWRSIYFFIPMALFIITAGLMRGGLIKSTFFPNIVFDRFEVDMAFTPGSGQEQTEEYIHLFDSLIWEVNAEIMKEFSDTNSFITQTYASIGRSFGGSETGSHAGNIGVNLRDMEGSPIQSAQIADRVREKITVYKEVDRIKIGGSNRWGSPVSITILGSDQETMEAAKDYLYDALKKREDLKNVSHNNPKGKQEVQLELKPKAFFLGLNETTIMTQVRQSFFGGQVQRLQDGKDEVRVWVRYPKQDRLNLSRLEEMKVFTPQGGEYPLSELASYKIERGPVSIKRYNGQKEITVEADMKDDEASASEISEDIKAILIPELKNKFPGIDIDYLGQEKGSNESAAEMQKYFIPALLLIVIVLMIHFRSIGQALIVLMMIPLGIMGGLWGHGVEGVMVSMLSAWGLVALTGVIINDAVVFMAKYNSSLLEGKTVKESVIEAGVSRFRPILLTTITTTAGLYPLIFEKSFQAQLLKPMAISLAYGVGIGTMFILTLLPVCILILNDLKVHLKWLWTGTKPTREEVEKVIINSKRTID